MQFVRAPDENVFIAPFNLIEVFGLSLLLEWWMSKERYEKINDVVSHPHITGYGTCADSRYQVMGFIYSPLLLITAFMETRTARIVKFNRSRHESDDDTIEEWEQLQAEMDVEGSGWSKRVEESAPNVVTDGTLLEVQKLREEMKEMREMVKAMGQANGHGGS